MKVNVVQLRKYFGATRAVDGITFAFESGQIFGFVGPNGAGKSSTMRILATLDEPTSGEATIEDIEEFTNLLGIREKHLNALSKGMKNRVSVARALVHDPPVLLMDEPAAGLDPRARIELRELLKVLS